METKLPTDNAQDAAYRPLVLNPYDDTTLRLERARELCRAVAVYELPNKSYTLVSMIEDEIEAIHQAMKLWHEKVHEQRQAPEAAVTKEAPRNVSTAAKEEFEFAYVKAPPWKRGKWITSSSSPKTVDDLEFTSRDESGAINWWDVQEPRTQYWEVHRQLGRAYAIDLLDLIHNANAEIDPKTFGYIASAIVRQRPQMDGLHIGFFERISEYLIAGDVNR